MAQVDVLFEGYVGLPDDDDRVASTVSLIRDGHAIVVVDPGFVPRRSAILDPIRSLGLEPTDVTDVVFSHHHPDHTVNAALFPAAQIHDHWATYRNDVWTSRPAEGFRVSERVSLLATPGHTPQDVTTLAETEGGVVAFTHLWWNAEGPVEDPTAVDSGALHRGRARVLEIASLIVPGHGAPFVPGPSTAR